MCRRVWDKEEKFPPPLATGAKQPLWLQKRELLLYPQGWKNNLKSEREGECPVEQTQQQHMEQEVREQRKTGKKVAELC